MRTAMLAALAAVAGVLVVPAASAAASGEIVFVSQRSGTQELYVVGRDGGGLRRLTYNDLAERQPVWSPDRTRIAFAGRDGGGNWDIYTIGSAGGDLRRLTTDPSRDDAPRWTPDGRILYQHGPPAGASSTVWIVGADGTGARQLPTGDGDAITPSASPRDDKVAFASDRGQSGVWAIYTMQLNGQALRQVSFPSAGMDLQPTWSPSGNDLVFVRDNGTNDNDLYREHDNGSQLVRLTDTPGSSEFWPSWSQDGSELVYSAFDDASGFGSLHAIPSDGGASSDLSTIPQAPLAESFDGPLDSSLWHVISDPGGSIGVAGGRLVASISGSGQPGGQYDQIDEHVGSQCSLAGDFDLQVDYSLRTWPQFGGVYAALQAFFGNGGISRTSGPWDAPFNQQYVAYSDTGFASLNTLDLAGSLRIARTAGAMTMYERASPLDPWTAIFTGGAPNPVVYGMGLWANGQQFAHEDASVAFDDFRLTSGALTCPSWWESWGGDAAY